MRTIATALLMAAGSATVALAAQPSYVARDLGVLNEGFSLATAVSADGVATGEAGVHNAKFLLAYRAFTSTGRASLKPLNGPRVVSSFGLGINQVHTVVGGAQTQDKLGNTIDYAFAGTPGQPITLFGGANSQANAINDSGQAVGSLLSGSAYHVLSWTQASGVSDLGTFGGTSAAALGINNAGDLLVNISTPKTYDIPVLVRRGHAQRIDIPGALEAYGQAINARADIVGYYVPAGQGGTPSLAFAYTSGKLKTLPHVSASSTQSVAYGINAAGQIVGGDSTQSGQVTAVMWDLADGQAVDLNTLVDAKSGIHLDVAYAINDSGVIVGVGLVPGKSQEHAILLQPQ